MDTYSTHTTRLVSTFSPEDNSFNTKQQQQSPPGQNYDNDEDDDDGPDHYYDSHKRNQFRSRRQSSIVKYFSNSFATGHKMNSLFAFLLAFNLSMSILNTLMLSFVVKSVQLTDGGLFQGKLNWDEQLGATTSELPIHLTPGRSILTKSISSHADGRLLIENLSNQQQTLEGEATNHYKTSGEPPASLAAPSPSSGEAGADGGGGPAGRLVISASRARPTIPQSASGHQLAKSNFIIVNENVNTDTPFSTSADHRHREPVKIQTKSLVVSLINNGQASQHQVPGSRTKDYIHNKRARRGRRSPSTITTARNALRAANGMQMGQRQAILIGPTRRLLEFDGEQQSITLPLLDQLNLSPSLAGSLIVEKGLNGGAEIAGTLEENLE